jgi:hypothetical protein
MPKRTLVLTVTYDESDTHHFPRTVEEVTKRIKDRIEMPNGMVGVSNFLVTNIDFGTDGRPAREETPEQNMPEQIGNLVTQFMHELSKRRAETDQDRIKF